MNFRKIRRVVSAVSHPLVAKRVIYDDEAITAITSASYDAPVFFNLVIAQETVDEEVEADAPATPTQVTIGSVVKSIKLRLQLHGLTAQTRIRWMLFKDVDSDITANIATLGDAVFHGSDDTTIRREIRKVTLAKGFLIADSSNLRLPLKVFIRRKTMARLGRLKESDRLVLVIASSGAACKLTGFGTLWVSQE